MSQHSGVHTFTAALFVWAAMNPSVARGSEVALCRGGVLDVLREEVTRLKEDERFLIAWSLLQRQQE